jgi:phenylalanine-4-hydroxylase
MFEEGQLYAPVTEHADGSVTVHLAPDHPGATDPAYLARRNEIAAAALAWKPGTPAPRIAYTDAEHATWHTVVSELVAKHERLACAAYREAWERVGLPSDHVPQLGDIHTGFDFLPAAGLVPLREFYGSLADRAFHSTQYLRHPALPLYTPEPDLVHEVVGHGVALAAPELAELHRLTGVAARRLEDEDALRFLARAFWFTCEFGVIEEAGELRCYGAGLLSSYGEIEEFRNADVRPLDFLEMGTAEYDIAHYQPVLYATDAYETVAAFFDGFDDDTPARLERDAHQHGLRV